MYKLLFVVTVLFVGCRCGEPQARMPPAAQGRDNHDRPGMGPGHFQQDFQQSHMFPHQDMQQQGMHPPGMPSQGMHAPGMPSQGMHAPGMPSQGMHPGMPQQGMYMPFRPGPPHLMNPMNDPFIVIKRLEDELASKDHEIADLKAMMGQRKQHPHH